MFLAGKKERDRLIVSIEEEKESIVANGFAAEVRDINSVTTQHHSEATHKRRGPFLVAHFVATGIKPHHVFDISAADSAALEKFRPAKHRVISPQSDQTPGKLEQ